KHNIWRKDCHVVIVGYQARGTTGRMLVDGANRIRLWGETYIVRAQIHTVGGLSAHADQDGLVDWYGNFRNRPPLALVHGEPDAVDVLAGRIRSELGTGVIKSRPGLKLDLLGL
ncbi:MAG: MBL fold metallo-hydrolase, partial [Gammaproteobacteria bacterium]